MKVIIHIYKISEHPNINKEKERENVKKALKHTFQKEKILFLIII